VYKYTSYSLNIHSVILLPGLPGIQTDADVFIRQNNIDNLPSHVATKGSWFHATLKETYLVWENVCTIFIRDGREIAVDPTKGVDDGLLRQAILGPAFGLLLQQRGFLPLHASAVSNKNYAVAIAGESGKGKSAFAKELHNLGLLFVSDDITAVDRKKDGPTVYPGFPYFRLWPETIQHFGDDFEALPRLHSDSDKRIDPITRSYADSPKLLKTIFLLSDETNCDLEPLSPNESFLELLKLCYNLRLIRAAIGSSEYMVQIAELARKVPCVRLKKQKELSCISKLARKVLEHLAQLG